MKKTARTEVFGPKLPPVPRRVPKPRRTFALATEVAKAGGVTQVTLRDWVRRGILPPAIESLRGRGNITKYPRSAVQRAELTRRLRDDGWSLDAIAEYIATKWTDTEKPDAEKPDAENPDAENPDAENPDAENPDDAENPEEEKP